MVCGGPVNRRLGNVDSGLNNKRHYPRATHNSAPTADERSRELREREKERERVGWSALCGRQKENSAGTRRWKGIRGGCPSIIERGSPHRRPCCTIQRCPASVSILDTRSGRSGADCPADSRRTIAYVLYAIVFRETSGRHTRTLFAVLSFLLGPASRDNALPPSSENSTRVTLHLARVHSLAVLVFERTPHDIVYPLPPSLVIFLFFALCLFSTLPPLLPSRFFVSSLSLSLEFSSFSTFDSIRCSVSTNEGWRRRRRRTRDELVHLADRSCDHCRHNHGKFDSAWFFLRPRLGAKFRGCDFSLGFPLWPTILWVYTSSYWSLLAVREQYSYSLVSRKTL